MKNRLKYLIALCLLYFLKVALWFRYRVTIKGFEKLNKKNLNKPGGVLFLPNHPTVFVDPTLITLAVFQKFPLRPIIVEYMYYTPIIYQIMRLMDGIPIPSFEMSTNSLKRKRSERVIQEIVRGLEQGQNFLVYPAGRVKSTAHEVIGGASGVYQAITECPEANIVLVRITGLWGSSFSKALTGKSVYMFSMIWQGMKHAFKNLLFFTPRREVKIEFQPVGKDFPRDVSKLEMNRYLEDWYNRPDGLSTPTSEYPGETLNLVSYSVWRKQYPSVKSQSAAKKAEAEMEEIPEEVQEKIIYKLAKMTELPPTRINPDMELSSDLGLDSLDISELVVFLEDQFDIRGVAVNELTTVSRVMGIASGKIEVEAEEEESLDIKGWKEERIKQRLYISKGETIPQVFFNICDQMKKNIACADLRSGILSYSTLKLRVLILADYIKTLPGEHIGVLLPSSVAASMCILAIQIAGKVPVMINWTVGPRHLETVVKLSGVKKIFTSWAFVDRLANVDLSIIDEQLVMLENIRREISMFDKLKGYLKSRRSMSSLLRHYGLTRLSAESRAVVLFTSGTENMPKGVPLSHRNILVNQRQAADAFPFYSNDILLGILPPFHSFGFTITTLLPLLSGIRVAYSPDPTDGSRVAKAIERWKATLVCGAPTFLKNMLKVGETEQFTSLRYVVSGAEAATAELFQLMKQKGLKDRLIEGYGITECSPVLTMNRPNLPKQGVGQAGFGIELLIIHPETEEILSAGKTGVILARGPNIFSGYLNKDTKSPFITIQGKEWYNTGDLGFLDEEGYLTISGRLKRFIKIGAEMISLASIENALIEQAEERGWPLPKEGHSIAVCARETPGEKPLIYVFATFKTSLEGVNEALRKAGVSNLVKIAEFKKIDEIPLMGTGKVNYRELESKYLGS